MADIKNKLEVKSHIQSQYRKNEIWCWNSRSWIGTGKKCGRGKPFFLYIVFAVVHVHGYINYLPVQSILCYHSITAEKYDGWFWFYGV